MTAAPRLDARLDAAIQAHLGAELRAFYGDTVLPKLPIQLRRLANRVSQVIRAHTQPVDQGYIDEIMAALPSLKAFAISLTSDIGRAEDLVQETVLKAISNQEAFVPGSNLQAWMFTILRNNFYTSYRRTKREVEDSDGAFAASLIAIPEQEGRVTFRELQAALKKLPTNQREALLLVSVEGMAYDEAADVLGIRIGTVKSRINRARAGLTQLMGLDNQ